MKIQLSTAALLVFVAAKVQALSLNIRNDVPGNATFPTLYGYMYEDINRCGDGGLYGEMIRNRAFQMNDTGGAPDLAYYASINGAGASSTIALDASVPLNDVLTHTLRLDVKTVGKRAGFSNEGYWGIRVAPNELYTASFWAKSDKFTGPLTVSLESTSGTILATATVPKINSTFAKYQVSLKSNAHTTTTDNVFVVSTADASAAGASIWFDVISLFPPTFKNRRNGLRADVGQILADGKPSFFRFPGGNNIEGSTIAQRWKWNETIGPIETRPGRMGTWGYMNTDGQGLLEYLEMCEDLEMEPLLAVWAGYALNGDSVPEGDLGPYVQDTLDELEYIMGDASSKYGALRVRDGHPEPFKINYIEVGNEDFFSKTYDYRYKAWYDAIHAAYPDIKIVATGAEASRPMDVLDDHYYLSADNMVSKFGLYDNYPHNGTWGMVGEYATQVNGGYGQSPGNVKAAIADGIFALGMERSNYIKFAAYAPTLTRDGQAQWNPDLISFNTELVWGTPSYYVLQMWSEYRNDYILQVDAKDGGFGPLYWVAGVKNSTQQVFLKVANYGDTPQNVAVTLTGHRVHSQGVAYTLTGGVNDTNSATHPTAVKPQQSTFKLSGSNVFNYTFPAWSASVLALHYL
ncbi:glycoside hydrolase superfamily [Gongronella butleri]|nr:glycoside hydrolase superfamily [Gongronella butleri]